MKVSVCSNNLPYGNKGQMIFPANKGDAGHDLVAHSHPRIVGDCYIQSLFTSIKYIEYDTNITLKPSEDNYGDYELFSLVYPRSSISDFNLSLCNSVGVIDSGYRGEIIVKFHCNTNLYSYNVGDRVAQLIIMPYPQVEFEEVEELSDTDRGAGGFGSTGA